MDFNKEIVDFISDKVGGIIIYEKESERIVFADDFAARCFGEQLLENKAGEVFSWYGDCPELSEDRSEEWESIDVFNKKYYRFNSAMFEKEGKKYVIHQITDITEYMILNHDVTKYMSFFKKLSSFQSAILEKLSDSYIELLPLITDYFKTDKAYFFVERNAYLEIVSFTKKGKVYTNDRLAMTNELTGIFEDKATDEFKLPKEISEVLGVSEDRRQNIICSGEVSGQRFAIYLDICAGTDIASLKETTLISVVKLYAENALMREKLIYDSEHDHLTGLYNKGKYLDRIDNEYKNRKSIAIFNFDVNNLKKMNDTYGHEAGDRLIIKAADSIRKVTKTNVHGYRMGGDEFLMVAVDISEEEALSLKQRWEDELLRLNTIDTDINCVMALGMTYGEGDYDLQTLLSQADELMYEDKKRKKKPGEEIR